MKMKLFLGLPGVCAVGALFVACGSGSVADIDRWDNVGAASTEDSNYVKSVLDSCKADPACSGKVVVTSSATVVTPSSSSNAVVEPTSSSAVVIVPSSSSKAVIVPSSSSKAVVVSSSSAATVLSSSSATATSSSSAASGTATAITMSYGGTAVTFTAGVTYSITYTDGRGSLVCSGSGTVACGSSAAVTLSSWGVKIGEDSECATGVATGTASCKNNW